MDNVYSVASSLNLQVLSVLSIRSLDEALSKAAARLVSWQAKGFAADMGYMNRDEALFSNPRKLLPEVKSIITFAVPYFAPNTEFPKQEKGFGKVARYAWGLDYHTVLKKILENFVVRSRELGVLKIDKYRIFSDSVPTLERAIAEKAGIGFVGKSSLLIRPGMGSYFFICEILLDSELEDSNPPAEIKSNCGSCTNCMTSCPTNAIVENRVVDAGKCISYLTIEKRGLLLENEITAIGDWVFGCDVCQEVCPYNHKGVQTNVPEEFLASQGVGPYLELARILEMKTKEEFKAKFKETPLMRTKREGLVRNAMAVTFNQKNFSHLDLILNILKKDESELLRNQARIVLNAFMPFLTGLDRIRVSACETV